MDAMLFTQPKTMIFTSPGVNTFRKGDKWAALKVGDLVQAKIKTDAQEVDHSTMRVTGVCTGDLKMMLDMHAIHNHAIICKSITKRKKAARKLQEILEGIYGASLPDDEFFTVVYLEWASG